MAYTRGSNINLQGCVKYLFNGSNLEYIMQYISSFLMSKTNYTMHLRASSLNFFVQIKCCMFRCKYVSYTFTLFRSNANFYKTILILNYVIYCISWFFAQISSNYLEVGLQLVFVLDLMNFRFSFFFFSIIICKQCCTNDVDSYSLAPTHYCNSNRNGNNRILGENKE